MKRVGIEPISAEQIGQLRKLEAGININGIEIRPYVIGIDRIGFLIMGSPEAPEFSVYAGSNVFQQQIHILRDIADKCGAIIFIAIDAGLLRGGVMTSERNRARDFRDWLVDECSFQPLQKNGDVVLVGYDPTGPLTLAEVIADLEHDAAQRERQSKHGSALSSMSEDMAEGHTATVLREIVAKLKRVRSID